MAGALCKTNDHVISASRQEGGWNSSISVSVSHGQPWRLDKSIRPAKCSQAFLLLPCFERTTIEVING